jgi:hypothetical protein
MAMPVNPITSFAFFGIVNSITKMEFFFMFTGQL